jgi:LysM repeat protein
MASANFGAANFNIPQPLQTGDEGSANTAAEPTTASSSAGSASAAHDTKVFGNLEGRDPDLLFAGEKIMINGKQVTVADGDTLSSLAAKHGTTVEKLIAENKMDASLLGKNGPNGAYFTPGGPQPAPGGSETPRPNALAPQGPDGTYTKEQVPALRAEVERLQKEGTLAPKKATDLMDLLKKIEDGDTLSASEATKLTGLMKDLKAAQANSTSAAGSTTGSANNGSPGTAGPGSPIDPSGAPTNSGASTPANQGSGQGDGLWSSLLARDPGMNADDGVLKSEDEIRYQIFGGEITPARAELLLARIDRERSNPNSVFSSDQLDHLAKIIAAAPAPKGDGGMGLSAVEKYAINMLGKQQNAVNNRIALNGDDQSTGSASLA